MSAVAGQEYRCFVELDRERVAIGDHGRTVDLSQHSFGCEVQACAVTDSFEGRQRVFDRIETLDPAAVVRTTERNLEAAYVLRSWFLGDDDSDPEDRIGRNATAIPTGDPDRKL